MATEEEKDLKKIQETGKEARAEAVEFKPAFRATKGASEEVVRALSEEKDEPEWMLDFRLDALKKFHAKPMPAWGPSLDDIDFENISYYVKPLEEPESARTWEDVPEEMKRTYDRLGVPRAEAEALAGVANQWDSEVVFHDLRKDLEEQGVVFLDMDSGLREHEEIVRRYFGKLIPAADNKFAALNSAFWSGGCLTAETRINTPEKITNIDKIEKGDKVYALNDKGMLEEQEVLAKVNNGKKPTYTVQAGGRTIEATSNHPFLTLNKSKTVIDPDTGRKWFLEWKPLSNIKENDLIALALDIPNKGNPYKLPKYKPYIKGKHKLKPAPIKTTEDLMWLFGIWIGDGCNSKNDAIISFALPKEFKNEVRVEAEKVVTNLFGCTITPVKSAFQISSRALVAWFKDNGFVGKAHTKRIPEWVWGLPRNQKMAFLGGILDSDGWLENKGKTFRIELCNKNLVQDIQSLCISCGLYANGNLLTRKRENTYFEREDRHIKTGVSYSCRVTGAIADIKTRNPKAIAQLKEGKKNKRTVKKYLSTTKERFKSMTTEHLGFAPIKKKEYLGLKEVFDIQVNKLSNFVANGLIVHNSFIYVPKGVHVEQPLQTYFRINSSAMMQAERTLIIADEGSKVSYLEGCSAQAYSAVDSIHAAVVELIALPGSEINYFTAQNWDPRNVWNMVTKRARAEENSTVRWIQGELGSKVNMKYPSIYLMGEGAHAEILSVAFAGEGQNQDTGGKAIHVAPNTSSQIISKSISSHGGVASYRGLLEVAKGAENARSRVVCDALILDDKSASNTWPTIRIGNPTADVGHEATVSKVGEEQMFYLMSHGISEEEAQALIVNGFIESVVKEMPMEYAVEINRLIELQMEGSIG